MGTCQKIPVSELTEAEKVKTIGMALYKTLSLHILSVNIEAKVKRPGKKC